MPAVAHSSGVGKGVRTSHSSILYLRLPCAASAEVGCTVLQL